VYFVLACFSPDDADHAILTGEDDDPRRMWQAGEKFDPPPREPVRAVVEEAGVLPEFTDDGIPMMSRRLLESLRSAGVDNIDAYAAEILDPAAGKTYTSHVAFNVVGKIAAADPGGSEFDPSIPWFDKLVLDPAAPHGALLFRLAESVNALLVHESVKAKLEADGIDTLTFLPPEEWAG
jgi:hypothetical protein